MGRNQPVPNATNVLINIQVASFVLNGGIDKATTALEACTMREKEVGCKILWHQADGPEAPESAAQGTTTQVNKNHLVIR